MIHEVTCAVTSKSQCQSNEAEKPAPIVTAAEKGSSGGASSLASPEELANLGGFDVPSADEARHLMRELDWGDHLDVMDLNAAAGESWLHLYALNEAAKFFRYGTAGLGFKTGGSGSVSFADQDRLVAWIETKIGDVSLAKALRARFEKASSYHDVLLIVSRLIDLRCMQLALIAEE
ncbi:MAG: hypothetical protein Q4A43_01720 [Coriobacteriia bacterium]|nr:hypothetical protein [Coriobacteriia bacterium]